MLCLILGHEVYDFSTISLVTSSRIQMRFFLHCKNAMYRDFPLLIFGLGSLLLGGPLGRRLGLWIARQQIKHHRCVEFDNSFDLNETQYETLCFNKSMVNSIVSSPLSLELEKALLEYGKIHVSYLPRLPNSQYLEFENSDDLDSPDRYRWWLRLTNIGSQYDGNILAALGSEAKVVHFPANFTLNRFEQTVYPDKVHNCQILSLLDLR